MHTYTEREIETEIKAILEIKYRGKHLLLEEHDIKYFPIP